MQTKFLGIIDMDTQKQIELEVAMLFLLIYAFFLYGLLGLKNYIEKKNQLKVEGFDPFNDEIFEATDKSSGKVEYRFSFTKDFK